VPGQEAANRETWMARFASAAGPHVQSLGDVAGVGPRFDYREQEQEGPTATEEAPNMVVVHCVGREDTLREGAALVWASNHVDREAVLVADTRRSKGVAQAMVAPTHAPL